MSQFNSKLKIRVVAALMVLVSVSSISPTCAYHAESLAENATSDVHDASYIKSIQNGAKTEFVNDAPVMSPAAELSSPAEALPEAIPTAESASSDFWGVGEKSNIEGSAENSGTEVPAVPGGIDLEGRPIAALPSLPITPPIEEAADVIVIDNDMYKQKSENSAKDSSSWSTVKAENGKTMILAGARFPVVLVSSHNSKNCRIGDRVEARLKADILIGERLIAKMNDHVLGHVTSSHKARRLLIAQLAPKRWMRANGAIGIKFDEIITYEGQHIALTAAPARMARIIENKNEGRVLGVNHKGEIAAPLSTQLKNQGVQLAIRGAAGAGGIFSMGAVPVLFGLIGALHPEFAFLHPVGKNMPHRRLKGFGMGFLNGLPGGFIIADWVLRGVESVLKPGDEFLVEFQQDFNGEVSTTAQLEPQERTKVRAEIVKPKKSKTRAKAK